MIKKGNNKGVQMLWNFKKFQRTYIENKKVQNKLKIPYFHEINKERRSFISKPKSFLKKYSCLDLTDSLINARNPW